MKLIPALLIAFAAFASTAAAQPAPVLQIRSAVGASTYLSGDIGYTAPMTIVSARIGTGSVALEPEFAFARHQAHAVFSLGQEDSRRTFQSVGVNVVRRWRGRIAPYVGGGVGVFVDHLHTTTVSRDAETFVFDRAGGPTAGVQAFGGADVRVAGRISILGQGRYELRSLSDLGGGSAWQVMGGVAVDVF